MAKRKVKFKKPYRVATWFERDRSYIALYDAEDDIIVDFWDEDVNDLVEDGYLDPGDYYGSLVEYAKEMGLIP